MLAAELLILVVGFIALIKGADLFVDGSAGLAKNFGVPGLIIGLTVVALGTSAPELAVSTSAALQGSNDATVMAHLKENEGAVRHAMDVIADDLAWLCENILEKTGVEGIYQSVQGAEVGRMTRSEYRRIVAPSELKIIERSNAVRDHNILHMCSWAGNRNHLLYWKDYPVRVKNWGIGIEGLSLTQAEGFFPEGTVLLGGLDNRRTHPLYAGSVEEIQACVRACVREMEGRPFILGADCTVPGDIDRSHIRAALEALRT